MMNIHEFKDNFATLTFEAPITVTFDRCFLASFTVTVIGDAVTFEADFKDGKEATYEIDMDALTALVEAEHFGRAFNLIVKRYNA